MKINEKIQEALVRSGMPNEDLMDIFEDNTKCGYMRNFAELIVQECVKVCMAERDAHQEQSAHGTGRSSDFAFGSVMSAERIAETIKEHFGVII